MLVFVFAKFGNPGCGGLGVGGDASGVDAGGVESAVEHGVVGEFVVFAVVAQEHDHIFDGDGVLGEGLGAGLANETPGTAGFEFV